eukprot:CAMPEP_0115202588 /NCGR_PEP_ID=MMETSP0270-20121206/18210_1 /TAXON_ID=71861 /ORGANISM="Scrippsiella trochoidea, Strain CCMP3099" /LENGTH=49 /DNA_ID=CAMNT_0002616019 /DNA_START=1 /DNA_END=150 /DNA_ORIENTATION=-
MPSTQNMCGTITSGAKSPMRAIAPAKGMRSAAAKDLSSRPDGKLQVPSM